MLPADPRYAPAIINSASQGSLWVVATDLNSATLAPNDAPAVVSGRQLAGGTDPASPAASDRIAVVTKGSSTALLDYVSGVININMPGETTASVLSALLLYVQARPYTFGVLDCPSGQTPAGVVSFFNTLSPATAFASMYYPWQNASNPASPNLGATILLPPGGIVLGQMVKSDNSRGVWKAPAGLATQLSNVVSAERRFSSADLDVLTASNINALRTRANGTIVIWGTRTMLNGYATKFIPVRRTLNYIEAALAQLLDFAVFEPNDPLLWTNITATCNTFLGNLWSAGAFGSYPVAQSYYVTCNSTNNTPQTINQGIVNTTVGVALLIPAEFVALNIAQFQTTGSTTVTQIS
jgi:phage tail sheath protein FI